MPEYVVTYRPAQPPSGYGPVKTVTMEAASEQAVRAGLRYAQIISITPKGQVTTQQWTRIEEQVRGREQAPATAPKRRKRATVETYKHLGLSKEELKGVEKRWKVETATAVPRGFLTREEWKEWQERYSPEELGRLEQKLKEEEPPSEYTMGEYRGTPAYYVKHPYGPNVGEYNRLVREYNKMVGPLAMKPWEAKEDYYARVGKMVETYGISEKAHPELRSQLKAIHREAYGSVPISTQLARAASRAGERWGIFGDVLSAAAGAGSAIVGGIEETYQFVSGVTPLPEPEYKRPIFGPFTIATAKLTRTDLFPD